MTANPEQSDMDTYDGSATRKPFLAHLEDLRLTILQCAGSYLVGLLISIPFTPWIVNVLRHPMNVSGLSSRIPLRITTVGGPFLVAMRVDLWTGLLLSLPFMLLFVAQFVFPGLTRREQRVVVRGVICAVLLFVMGVAMGYVWTLPVALVMMVRISDWLQTPPAFWEIADYIVFCLRLLVAFGLAFQLPVVLWVMGRLGWVSSRLLRTYRRHVIVGLLVLAMFLTPQDPFTMLLMAVPLILLYEACIWLIRAMESGESVE